MNIFEGGVNITTGSSAEQIEKVTVASKELAKALGSINTRLATFDKAGGAASKFVDFMKGAGAKAGAFKQLNDNASTLDGTLKSLNPSLRELVTLLKQIPNKSIKIGTGGTTDSISKASRKVETSEAETRKAANLQRMYNLYSKALVDANRVSVDFNAKTGITTEKFRLLNNEGKQYTYTVQKQKDVLIALKRNIVDLSSAMQESQAKQAAAKAAYDAIGPSIARLTPAFERASSNGQKLTQVFKTMTADGRNVTYTITKLRGEVTAVDTKITQLTASQLKQIASQKAHEATINRAATAYLKIKSTLDVIAPTTEKVDSKTGQLVRTYVTFSAAGERTVTTLKYLNGVLQQVQTSTAAVTSSQKRQQEAIARAKTTYASIAESLKKAQLVSESYSSATGKLVQVYRGFNSAGQQVTYTLAKINGELVRVDTKTREAETSAKAFLLSWGSIARIFAGQVMWRGMSAISNELREASREAYEVRKSIVAIMSISQQVPMKTEQWLNGIISVSNKTGFAVKDVAEAIYDITSNQIAQGSAAIEVANEATKAATVMRSTTKEAVDIGSSVINAYNMQLSDLPDIYAKVFKAVEVGRFLASDIANDFGLLTVPAAQLGISLDAILGSFAGITEQGVDASKTMTQLRNMLMALLKPSDAMKELLRDMGVVSGQAAIKTYGWTGLLIELEKRTKGAAGETAALFQNLRGMQGALGQTGRGLDLVIEATNKIGQATETYEKAYKLMLLEPSKQLDILLNQLKNQLIPVFSNAIKLVGSNAEAFKLFGFFLRDANAAFKDFVGYHVSLISLLPGVQVLKYFAKEYVAELKEEVRLQEAFNNRLEAHLKIWKAYSLATTNNPLKELGATADNAFKAFNLANVSSIQKINGALKQTAVELKGIRTAAETAMSTLDESLNATVSKLQKQLSNLSSIQSSLESKIESSKQRKYEIGIEKSLQGKDLATQYNDLQTEYSKLSNQLITAINDPAVYNSIESRADFIFNKYAEVSREIEVNKKELARLQGGLTASKDGKSERLQTKEVQVQNKDLIKRRTLLEKIDKINDSIRTKSKLQTALEKKLENNAFASKKERKEAEESLTKTTESLVKLNEAKVSAKQTLADYDANFKLKTDELKKTGAELKEDISNLVKLLGDTSKITMTALQAEEEFTDLIMDKRLAALEEVKKKENEIIKLQQQGVILQQRMQVSKDQIGILADLAKNGGGEAGLAGFREQLDAFLNEQQNINTSSLDLAEKLGLNGPELEAMSKLQADNYKVLQSYTEALAKRVTMADQLQKHEKAYDEALFAWTTANNQLQDLERKRQEMLLTLASGYKAVGPELREQAAKVINTLKPEEEEILAKVFNLFKFAEKPAALSNIDPEELTETKRRLSLMGKNELVDVLDKLSATLELQEQYNASAVTELGQINSLKTEMDKLARKFPELETVLAQTKATANNTTALQNLQIAITNLMLTYRDTTKLANELAAPPEGKATGGFAGYGTDTVRALLTKGEFVVNKGASARFAPLLHAINSTSRFASGGPVGNVNVGDVNINMSGSTPTHTAMSIGRQLQKLVKQGLLRLN